MQETEGPPELVKTQMLLPGDEAPEEVEYDETAGWYADNFHRSAFAGNLQSLDATDQAKNIHQEFAALYNTC